MAVILITMDCWPPSRAGGGNLAPEHNRQIVGGGFNGNTRRSHRSLWEDGAGSGALNHEAG